MRAHLRHLDPAWWCYAAATFALLLAANACAPVRPAPGALAPVQTRTTNEIRYADLATIDAWEARRTALLRNDGPDLFTRSIVLARAGAWLAFARESYLAHPHASDADDALGEARRLMESLSAPRGMAIQSAPSALMTAARTLDPALWARLQELERHPTATHDVISLADAEIELVRAAAKHPATPAFSVALASVPAEGSSNVVAAPELESAVVLPANISAVSVSGLACPQVRHLARAGRLLLDEASPVVLAGAAAIAPLDELRSYAHTVHFALRSDVLHGPGAALLDGVAAVMRRHPEVGLLIEGNADPRGADTNNLLLSGRRAERVRQWLVTNGVDGDRVVVRMFGAQHRDATGTTPVDYARDRRVQLRFVQADGTELPALDDASDLQIESEHVWTGAQRPGLRRFVPEPGSTVAAPPVPVAPRKSTSKHRRTAKKVMQ